MEEEVSMDTCSTEGSRSHGPRHRTRVGVLGKRRAEEDLGPDRKERREQNEPRSPVHSIARKDR